MENLKGKVILIGREPGQGRLLIAIAGSGKGAVIGSPGSVPRCVSRCLPVEGKAHAKISIGQDGNMTLTNMKSENVTYVKGSEIVSKRIGLSDTVELGKDHFSINIPTIIETAEKLVGKAFPPPPPSKIFNISHLEYVWNDYHDKVYEIKSRQRAQTLWARVPVVFTVAGGIISGVVGKFLGPYNIITYIPSVIGITIMVYLLIKSKNDTSIEDLERLTENFQERYVCPNPDCNKFLGNLSYKLLKKQYSMHCPYCKCEFVEKK